VGGQANVELKFNAPAPGTIAAAVTVTGGVPMTLLPSGHLYTATATGSISIVVASPPLGPSGANMSVNLKGGRTAAVIGRATTVTATIANAGPSDASPATITFSAPPGLHVTRLRGAGAACDLATLSCAIERVWISKPRSVVVTLRAAEAGRESISAHVKLRGDPIAKNNTAKLTLRVRPAAR
jgi:hypothetical protein